MWECLRLIYIQPAFEICNELLDEPLSVYSIVLEFPRQKNSKKYFLLRINEIFLSCKDPKLLSCKT